MLLSALSPPIFPEALVSQLKSLGILTATDLLFSNGSPLEIYSHLSLKTVSLTEFERGVDALLDRLAAPGYAASELDNQIEESRLGSDLKVKTFPALDDHLGGGLPLSRVIEVSGDRGSGKTALLLNCVLKSLVKHEEMEVLWIDTTGDFAIERVVQILHDLQQMPNSELELEPVLERLQISTATMIESVQEILRALEIQLAYGNRPRMKCIVIDSITPLLGPYLSAVSSQGHAIMTGFMRHLRNLVVQYSLLILLVNNATFMRSNESQPSFTPVSNPQSAFASTIRKPALGPSFAFMTDATLWVSVWPETGNSEKERDGSTAHTVEVFRSKFSVSNVWSTFRISRTGTLLSSRPGPDSRS